MVNHELNKEISDYLSSRRKTNLKEQFYSTFRKKQGQALQLQKAVPEQSIEVIEEEQDGLITRWLQALGFGKEKDAEAIDAGQAGQTTQEVSTVSKEQFEAEEKEFSEEVRQTSFVDRILGWFSGGKEEEAAIVQEPLPESDFRKQIEELETEESRIEEQEELLKKKKSEILKAILDKFVVHMEHKQSPLDKDEFKEIAKITLSVIKKLRKQDLDEFRQSYDFSRFKEILKAHNLLKDKKEDE